MSQKNGQTNKKVPVKSSQTKTSSSKKNASKKKGSGDNGNSPVRESKSNNPLEPLWKLLRRVQKIDRDSIKRAFAHHLEFTVGKNRYTLSEKDIYLALAYTIRDHLIDRWNATQQTYYDKGAKRVYYLSMEFLLGRSLGNALINLRAYSVVKKAMAELGFDLDLLMEREQDAGLGNGGLGRLAACFLDSMASMSLPGYGYGIRYDYGIFKQKIVRGFQTEIPDMWLAEGNPWEIKRFDFSYPICFYGHVESYHDEKGELHFTWVEGEKVLAKPYDLPIPGYSNHTVNNLRLWSAEPTQEFNFDFFNKGDYIRAVEEKINSENISSVLYPNDKIYSGKELRLKQQYFMVSASLQDIIRRFCKAFDCKWEIFPEKNAIQLNDTHPAIAIPEFMRIMLDEKGLGWEQAWDITIRTFAYTNHTMLPEALEKWSVALMERLLPRHIQIIYEINERFLNEVEKKFPGDKELLARVSLIKEGVTRKVRMAYLAIVGSHTVNGVAELHSQLIKETIFADFYKIYPERFQNKTNGITQRRWLARSNTNLAKLVTKKIGKGWITDLYEMKKIEKYAEDESFQKEWAGIKRNNKEVLANIIKESLGLSISPDSLFDVQIKRIHEYKRQHMNIFNVISMYQAIKESPNSNWTPRTVFFSGKSAPGYYIAKLIIKLIHSVASIVNSDKQIKDLLKVVFIPDYSVSLAEKIIPASDLSEQISTAGMEASGTGNMKFALNGAITIGTLDGANIEIKEEVGDENIMIFGLLAREVQEMKKNGYNPYDYYASNPRIKMVVDFVKYQMPSDEGSELYAPLINTLFGGGDPYMVLADLDSYMKKQIEVSKLYLDTKNWWKMSILNSARMGKFSSDRTIAEYAKDIWHVKPVKINAPEGSVYWK